MSPRKKAAPVPVRRTSAALAAIPRRTRVWVTVHADPLAGTLDDHGQPLPTRVEYLPRAERRARARHNGRQMVPGALEPYQKPVAA